jgi:hypothetical protein
MEGGWKESDNDIKTIKGRKKGVKDENILPTELL